MLRREWHVESSYLPSAQNKGEDEVNRHQLGRCEMDAGRSSSFDDA